jgi:predicted porin
MQKKLIALAVATLASGAAFAQSNVQIYGSVDMGFSHRGDNIVSGVDNKNAIDSGISAGNRLGFKGVEDLGNGLKALFTLEAGFGVDTGESAQGGRLFGRQAFVGLTGDFGTAIAGRLYTPHYTMLSTIDPFAGGTVGQYRNTMGIGLLVDGENVFDPTRVDNAVAYVSPSFSGFNVTAAYSTNGINGGISQFNPATGGFGAAVTLPGTGRQEAIGNQGDNRVFAIMPRYTNGPLDLMANYHQINLFKNMNAIDDKITNWAVGGTYDFGVAKLAAFYDYNKWDNATNALNALNGTSLAKDDLKMKSWMIGVTVPYGKHAVMASYNRSKLELDHGADGSAHQWALGYTYSLSKRTNLYAAYADINNDDGKNDLQRTTSVGDNSNVGQGYQNGFQLGLKHAF